MYIMTRYIYEYMIFKSYYNRKPYTLLNKCDLGILNEKTNLNNVLKRDQCKKIYQK